MQQASGSPVTTMERLQYRQGALSAPRTKASEPAREPRCAMELGCSRGRSVQAARLTIEEEISQRCGGKTAPTCNRTELEKGAQENRPQHPDACSARSFSPTRYFMNTTFAPAKHWRIYSAAVILGRGRTEAEAWRDAARRMR